MRPLFRFLSRYVLVPLYRLRLGWLVANPISGYAMIIRTKGRRTGRPRDATVMYAIGDGCVYCMAGWGPDTAWYRNVLAQPSVSLLMPGRIVAGVGEEVLAPSERAAALRRVLQSSGLSAFTEGVNPWRDGDEALLANAVRKPVVRVRPVGEPLIAGRFDPGGKGWLLGPTLLLAAMAFARSSRRVFGPRRLVP
jgi:deazaflavin-dependent oxidoreductase (nitroreductase family)